MARRVRASPSAKGRLHRKLQIPSYSRCLLNFARKFTTTLSRLRYQLFKNIAT